MRQKHQYVVDIRWSDEDEVYIARVPELAGVVTHGDSYADAAKMAEEAIDLHLASLKKHGETIPEPVSLEKLSGKFPLRLGKELHQNAVIRQHQVGAKSLNEYLKSLVELDFNEQVLEGEVVDPKTIKQLWDYINSHRPKTKKPAPRKKAVPTFAKRAWSTRTRAAKATTKKQA